MGLRVLPSTASMIVRKWAKFKERSGAKTSEIWESTSKARKASGVRLSGGGGEGRGSVPASLGTPMGRSISSLSNRLSIHELNMQDTGFSGCRRDIGKPNDPQRFWQQLGSSCEEVMQVGNGESSTCPPSSLYVNGASNFPAFLIKPLYNLPTIVASRMTFDVMDHHVLLFLVGVAADFNWENGSLIVDNPHAQPVLGKPCK